MKIEEDQARKESIQWQIKILEQAQEQFPNIEDVYAAHRQTTLPLVLLKYEHDRHLSELLPKCALEELGGYKPLTEE